MKPFLHKGPCLTSSHTKLRLTSVSVLLAGNTHRMGPLISLYICIGNGVAEKSQEEKKKNIRLPLVILYGSDSVSLYSTDSPWLN